jgi:hypothetical protein
MARLNTNNLQVATLQKLELQKPLSPISVPDYGETAAAVDAIYGSYIRRFDPDKPEEQFEVDVMAMSHVAIRRLAFCEAGVMETAARQVRAIPPDPRIPGLRAFDYTPENPEANKLVAGNAIIAIIKDCGGALEKLSRIQARVVVNFNKAHRALKEMRISPIDGNRREGPDRSLVEWHDPKSEGLPPEHAAPPPQPAPEPAPEPVKWPKAVIRPHPSPTFDPPEPFKFDDTEAGEDSQ